MIIAAFPIAGGVQINREIDAETMTSEMVMPEDPGWLDAVAAAAHFGNEIETSPIETPQQMIEARRAAAVMSRSEFLLRCTGLGVLSQSDALQAAHGQIPDSVASLITSWPEQDRFEVQVRWAALTQIERNHPMILVLADLMGLTPEGLDMIFGILTPEE